MSDDKKWIPAHKWLMKRLTSAVAEINRFGASGPSTEKDAERNTKECIRTELLLSQLRETVVPVDKIPEIQSLLLAYAAMCPNKDIESLLETTAGTLQTQLRAAKVKPADKS